MKVLVMYETSGTVRDAFAARGHDAWSMDVLPAGESRTVASRKYHIQCNIDEEVLGRGWVIQVKAEVNQIFFDSFDLIIAHPPCTYLTSSAEWAYGDGPYHQKVKPGTLVGEKRRAARAQALRIVAALMLLPCPRIAIENPVGKIGTVLRKADQYIQPYQFGHDASKRTGLWLKGLPKLKSDPSQRVIGRRVWVPTSVMGGYYVERWANGHYVERWANQTDSGQNRLSPSDDRWQVRSKTYEGVAKAMAEQWG